MFRKRHTIKRRNFGVKKTGDVLTSHFFWSKMRRDVERHVSHYTTLLESY